MEKSKREIREERIRRKQGNEYEALTREELIERLYLKQKLDLIGAKNDLTEYTEYVHRGAWIPARHLSFIQQKVLDFIDGKLVDEKGREAEVLILSMPPQHGKSQSITETVPSYLAQKRKNYRVIITGYNDDLVQRFNRRNREKVAEFGEEMFGVKLKRENASEIELSNGSSIRAAGFMSGITGNPADLIIIDDPIKNRQEAESDLHRKRMWAEFRDSIRTRLSAKGKIILIMTRWHTDDLAGRVQKFKSIPCVTVNLKCEAGEDDPLGREVGEALFPEIGKGDRWLQFYKSSYMNDPEGGPRSWNSLFQGEPTEEKGNIFLRDSFGFYDKTDAFIRSLPLVVMSVDASFKGEADNDKVSIQVWGKKGPMIYAIDNDTDLMGFRKTLDHIKKMLVKYPMVSAKFIEDKANGSAIIEQLNAEIGGFIPVKADVSTGGKVARAHAVEPYVSSGNVLLPRGEVWVEPYIDEMCSFPLGKYKDQVDATTQVLNKLIFYYAEVEGESHGYDDFFSKKKERDGYPVFDYGWE